MATMKQSDRLGLSTLEDISTLILQSHDLGETLNNIVELVARRMQSEVCSIYLLQEDGATLVLHATHGLPKESIGKVSMKLGQGLASLAIEQGQPISVINPEEHPRYLYFRETKEERFHSFLAIPLIERRQPIGVITLQTTEKRSFTTTEISALSTIAFQVSSVVTNAKLLNSINEVARASQTPSKKTHQNQELHNRAALRGTVAYPGVVSGPAYILDEKCGFSDLIDEIEVDSEKEKKRLTEALEETRIQTVFLEKRVAQKLSEQDAAIFHTHLMILEDRAFQDQLLKEITDGHSAPYALKKVVASYTEAFTRMDDPYLRERATDIMDIGRRLLANLTGNETTRLKFKKKGILVAREILPSDMATLEHDKVLGIVTEAGERNSHAVIMAKSLGIPALVGIKGATQQTEPGALVIVDANSGCFFVRPSEAIIEEYRRLEADCSEELDRINEYRHRPAISRDGVRVTMRANIGLISDVEIAQRNGAQGVGLYRTEFPYMTRNTFPDRQDQYQLYRKIVESFQGEPVTIRTLDIGGDKALPYFTPPAEDNPFMGWRSVRVSLDNRDIFRTQIEAILMAGVHGPVKMLFPMISGIEELWACKDVVTEAKEQLRREQLPFKEEIPLGIMIEVPAAVQMCKFLAHEVDFFSLGTNDLIQYMLAADRNNPLVNKYYNPLHPAVLQAIKYVSDTARKQGKGVCICGEMATDPVNFTVLLGLGIREFSVVAPFIPRTKAFLANLDCQRAMEISEQLLQMSDSQSIRTCVVDELHKMGARPTQT
ncbi:MAG: phosphoenolpyruvate--protein phosphotransferase [Desulfuromonadaceae bacterium]|nr:phosphoenolpyruvate--protein phosphotransferase [Desulfuromonadaceae bacterium]